MKDALPRPPNSRTPKGRWRAARPLAWVLALVVLTLPPLAALQSAHAASAKLHRHASVQHHGTMRLMSRQPPGAVTGRPDPPVLVAARLLPGAERITTPAPPSASVFVPPRP